MSKIMCVLGMAALATAAQAQVNGGFETGDLTGWNSGGDLSFTAVTANNPHSGTYSYQMGPVGGTGFIEQALAFNAGDLVNFDFWLAADADGEFFSASLDGVTYVAGSAGGGFGYTHFTFSNIAISNNAPIVRFEFQHSPAYWYLDDISVTAVPAPGAMALLGMGGLLAARRRRA